MPQIFSYYLFLASLPVGAVGFVCVVYLGLLYGRFLGGSSERHAFFRRIPDTKKNRVLLRLALFSLAFFFASSALFGAMYGADASVTLTALIAAFLMPAFTFMPLGDQVLEPSPQTFPQRVRVLFGTIIFCVLLLVAALVRWA